MALRLSSFSSRTLRARAGSSASLAKRKETSCASGKFRNARPQIHRQDFGEAQPHFKPNDAILHRQREDAREEREHKQRQRQQYAETDPTKCRCSYQMND